MKRAATVACALGFLVASGPAQADTKLSASGLAADLKVLKESLAALHPGLYRYNTSGQLERAYERLGTAWSSGATLSAAYLALSEFLVTLKCGHSYANFFNQEDAVATELFDKKDKVPFAFVWLDGQMVVTRDCSRERAFPRGTMIQAIDGVPVSRILGKLLRFARADGDNTAKRVSQMEIVGDEEVAAFDVFHSLCFPTRLGIRRYVVKHPGSPVDAEAVAASVRTRDRRSGTKVPARGSHDPMFFLSFPKPGVALLTMPSWAVFNSKWDWQGFLNESMESVIAKETRALVIDIGGNEGGLDCGDLVLARLVREPVALDNPGRFTRYRTVPSELRQHLSTWNRQFYDWGSVAKEAGNGLFRLDQPGLERSGVLQPHPRPFVGKVYVLIGPENSSATLQFAQRLKKLKLATLIGRPTGGNQRGINGGAFFFLTLPNSRIEVDIPLIAGLYDDVRPDAGIVPDVSVVPTPHDIAKGRDPALETAFRLAAKGQRE